MEGMSGSNKASQVNSFRIATVADRLLLHVGNSPKEEPFEFFNLCLSLARGIDYAVANDELPGKAQSLPNLLKKVCERKTLLLQAAIMVLMVSVKSACKAGWFSNEESKELLTLADEVASSFSSVTDMDTNVNNSLQNISKIMARFYPQLKMGLTLSSLEVKPGYGTYITDFHIPKNVKTSGEEKVRLFVAQTDNMETSSCLITPPQANFLINGKGVDKRTNVSLEGGPLLPTSIMHMLKYGTNILQVVGQFDANYVIMVAYASVISNLDKSVLLDYDQPQVAVQDQDSELVEGPSRISLNCPISFQRIKTPVKGHSCKHIQCFDFDNFVDINSRRPSWRCPHCNQCVSYADIRVDQYMAKVLKEVEVGVAEVIISADGSWNPVTKGNEKSNSPLDITPSCPQDVPSNIPRTVLDLTECDDLMDESGPIEIEDVKPILADIPNHFEPENTTVSLVTNNPNVVSQNEADFWSHMLMSTYSPENPAPRSHPQMFNSVANAATSSQLQLLQSQFGNSINEYGTDPRVTRQRVQVAVQGLPAQPPTTSVPQHTLMRDSSPNATSSMGDGGNVNYNSVERQIQMSRSRLSSLQAPHFNPLHTSPINPSQFQSQNWHHQNQVHQNQVLQNQVHQNQVHQNQVHQPTTPQAPVPTTSPRVSPLFDHQISRQYSLPPPNLRVPHNLNRSSSQSPHNHIPQQQQQQQQHHHQQQQHHHQQQHNPFSRRHVIGQPNRGAAVSSGPVASSAPPVGPTEEEWRPSGRMRGALQGEAYSAAHQQFIFQPVQPAQAITRPPTLPVLPLLVANSAISSNSATPVVATSSISSNLVTPVANGLISSNVTTPVVADPTSVPR